MNRIFPTKNLKRSVEFKKSNHKEIKKLIHYTDNDIKLFYRLLEKPTIKTLLVGDECYLFADKYLIAMTFIYFIRAQLRPEQYNELNFFAALYLAQDMEEDTYDMKRTLIFRCPGVNFKEKKNNLLAARYNIWHSMDYRAIVSRENCEMLMKQCPYHSVWNRGRNENHGGAQRSYCIKRCEKCTRNYEFTFNKVFDVSAFNKR